MSSNTNQANLEDRLQIFDQVLETVTTIAPVETVVKDAYEYISDKDGSTIVTVLLPLLKSSDSELVEAIDIVIEAVTIDVD